MKTIEQKLEKLLIDFGIDRKKVSGDTDYYHDLNLNMLDLYCLINKINHEFRVYFSEEEILRMERISDTVHFLRRKSGALYLN